MFAAHGCNAVLSWAHRNPRPIIIALAISICTVSSASADDSVATATTVPSLSQQIDRLLQPAIAQTTADKEQDGALLRRLSLDLRGVVPTREELEAFVADNGLERWAKWVDQFLRDPLCDENIVIFLDRTLMLRRGFTRVDRTAWINYLRDHVAADTSLDALSRELLFSPWWHREQRTAQRFYLDREGDPHLITRDIARVFLGRDVQCAQCHDHPLVDDYRQLDYHGLLASVSAGSLAEATYQDAEGKEQKMQLYVEKAAGDAPFESVFERGTMLRSGPRLPGHAERFDAYLRPDQRYVAEAPPGLPAGTPWPPKVSRRAQLAQSLANRENAAFVGNWANRLWALVFGRGLVNPVDLTHPDNPPISPELFRLISDGLLQADLRVKRFLRWLVMTDAYQRGGSPQLLQFAGKPGDRAVSELRKQIDERTTVLTEQTKSLESAESAARQAYEGARSTWLKAQSDRAKVQAELDTAESAMLDAKKKHDEAQIALAAAQKKLADNQSRIALLDESAAKMQQALALGGAEDAELAQAIAVAKQRADTIRGQVTELEKGVADSQAAVDSATTVLQQTTGNVDAIVAKLLPIHETLETTDNAAVVARSQWSEARIAWRISERETRHLQHMAAWLDGLTKTEQIAQASQAIEQQIAATHAESSAIIIAIDSSKAAITSAKQAVQFASQELDRAKQAYQQQQGTLGKLVQTLTALQSQRQALQIEQGTLRASLDAQAQAITDGSVMRFASAGLYPLSAEQMCWSTLRVTGVLDAYVRTEIGELEKQAPLAADADEATKAQRQRQAVRQAIEKLRGIADHYISLYASGPDKTQDDYFASIDQALYVANGGSVFSWAGPGNNNPTQVATTLADNTEVAKILYWSYLCRQPTADEIAIVAEQLASAGDQRPAVIQEMAWSLLASTEFRFRR